MFSKSCEYAIRATLYIVSKSTGGKRLSLKEVAKETGSPEHFTAKLLQILAREGIVASIKGPNGGFYIEEDASPVTLLKVVNAIDGNDLLATCGLGLKQCSDAHPCPMHNEYKKIRESLFKMLSKQTIQQLSKEINSGKTFIISKKR